MNTNLANNVVPGGFYSFFNGKENVDVQVIEIWNDEVDGVERIIVMENSGERGMYRLEMEHFLKNSVRIPSLHSLFLFGIVLFIVVAFCITLLELVYWKI